MSEREKQFNALERVEGVKSDPVGFFMGELLITHPELKSVAATEEDFSYLSPGQRAESLWAIFQSVKGLVSGRRRMRNEAPEDGKSIAAKSKQTKTSGEETLAKPVPSAMERPFSAAEAEKIKQGHSILKKLYEDADARQAYIDAAARYLVEIGTVNGSYEQYKVFHNLEKKAEETFDACARNMFAKRGSGTDELDVLLFETNKRRLAEIRRKLELLVEMNPELGALVQYEALKEGSRELRKEGFVWTPSRRVLLEEIELAAISGKPLLLSGESGTGKTRLEEQASLVLTGGLSNETPGKDVRFQDLIAKPKISSDGATYYEYKEIGEAATGKQSTQDEAPRHNGRFVGDDEFNLLPVGEQTERMARISAWTPGKRVRMPVTNEEVTIASHFLYVAMVNLASERYARNRIPPEVLRKFAKVDVPYMSQTEKEPELYEVMLMALLDENGRMRASRAELEPYYEYREEVQKAMRDEGAVKITVRKRELKNVKDEGNSAVPAGGFLWRFANALNEINKSFSHKDTVLRAKGEAQYLKDLIIDVGMVTGWMKEYTAFGRSESLESFMVGKLNSEFLKKEAYSAEDRGLVREFMAHFGIDTKKIESRPQPQFIPMTPLEIGLLTPRVRYEKIVSEEPVLTESYYVTDEGERIEYRIKSYEEGGRKLTPDQVITDAHGAKWEYLGINKATGDPIIVPVRDALAA